jgi:hypothetical protein
MARLRHFIEGHPVLRVTLCRVKMSHFLNMPTTPHEKILDKSIKSDRAKSGMKFAKENPFKRLA